VPAVDELLRRVDGIAERIRDEAPAADRARRLGDGTVQAIVDAGLHRMQLPAELGGSELTWDEAFRVIEAVARIDGATGWNLSIWAGAATMAVVLADEAARDEVLAGGLCSASLNFVNMKARRVDGGYVVDGKATFLSGSSHATWLSIGAWVHGDDGKPAFERGAPLVVRGIVPMAAVPVEDTWFVGGLRSTASNDAAIDGLFLADAWVSDPARGWALPDEGANHIPMQARFGAPFAHVGVGIALGALDALGDIAGGRVALGTFAPMAERVDVHIDTGRARALVESGRAFLDQTWRGSIAKVAGGERLTTEDLALLRLSYVTAAEHAAQATELVRRAAGSGGLYEVDRIERCWRDAHAVQVHTMVSPRGYERVGRVLLGLDPLPGIL
jgi:alkylation response protein AidB-like acyl-CoA dehydrogenase